MRRDKKEIVKLKIYLLENPHIPYKIIARKFNFPVSAVSAIWVQIRHHDDEPRLRVSQYIDDEEFKSEWYRITDNIKYDEKTYDKIEKRARHEKDI